MKARLGLIVLALACVEPDAIGQSGSSGIVISQIYGGGGNSGATLRNDFIELFNRGVSPVNVAGWSVQYASATGSSWDHTSLTGVIQPGQYYLVQEAQGTGGSAALPTPDASGGINLSATDGKVAVVSNSTDLSGTAPTGSSIIDFVGYGTANASESRPAPALTNTIAAIRQSSGCTDTDNNLSDFTTGPPSARNSHTAVHLCAPLPTTKADLVVTALTAPTSGTIGATLAGVSMTVTNQGQAAAVAFRVGFYFSSSTVMTSSTMFSGTSCSVSAGLAVGGTFTCSSTVTVPSSLAGGTWYLLASADDQNQVDESDEGNNVRAADTGSITLTGVTPPPTACGDERWSVKTGTDPDAALVNTSVSTPTTISALAALPPPDNLPDNNRLKPTETTVFTINATITQYKLETDSDYHVVIADSAGNTMIAEIPAPGCVGSSSPFAAAIASARSKFDSHLHATTSFQTANIPIQIQGVGFFDFLHGQTGVAPNGIELHPVLAISFNPSPAITSVDTVGDFQGIAQNDWIQIKGTNLAPSTVDPSGMTWSSAPEFNDGKMPTQLSGVSVKVNGKPAYVYYVSAAQINVLTPLDSGANGPVPVVVTVGNDSSLTFTASEGTVAPSFLYFGGGKEIVATHAGGSLLGPASMSVPGYTFTPAQPGETVSLYAVGFGLPSTTLVDGSASQFGNLPTLPVVQIGGASATVTFAGVVSPGLYLLNVTVPDSAASGDNLVAVTYGGATTPDGSVIAVQR